MISDSSEPHESPRQIGHGPPAATLPSSANRNPQTLRVAATKHVVLGSGELDAVNVAHSPSSLLRRRAVAPVARERANGDRHKANQALGGIGAGADTAEKRGGRRRRRVLHRNSLAGLQDDRCRLAAER